MSSDNPLHMRSGQGIRQDAGSFQQGPSSFNRELAAGETPHRHHERIPLADSDAAAGILSWVNPSGLDILVQLHLEITTPATGAATADAGQAATAILSDNLIDGLDVGAAAINATNSTDAGTNGQPFQRVSAGEFVTVSTASGAAAGLVGTGHIFYVEA